MVMTPFRLAMYFKEALLTVHAILRAHRKPHLSFCVFTRPHAQPAVHYCVSKISVWSVRDHSKVVVAYPL